MNKSLKMTLGLATLLMGSLLLGGCQSDGHISAADVRWNMSPELQSIALTSQQRKNMHARVIDTNLRQIWDDLDMVLLLDEPVRFSKYYIP